MVTGVYVPRWGITMEKATVVAWHAEEGDRVSVGQDLVELETEKMVNVVPSPGEGVLRKVLFSEGEVAKVGELLAVLAEPDEAFDLEALRGAGAGQGEGRASVLARREPRAAGRTERGRVRASPAARRLAEELGLDLAGLEGTGPEGSITREDVERRAARRGGGVEDAFVQAGALRLHYLAAGESSDRPPVILLHGLGGGALLWQGNLGALAEARRTYALDLPGHGLSDKPDAAYDVDFFVSALSGFLDALELERVALVGNSLGGQVALRFALEQPDRVEKLVLVASGGLGPEIDLGFLRPLLEAPTRASVETMLRGLFVNPRFATPLMIDVTLGGFQHPEALRAVRSAVRESLDGGDRQKEILLPRVSELRLPVLLAWGSADGILPVVQAERARQAIQGAELWIADGVGHCPQLEAVGEFNQRVTEFLEK